MATTVASSKFLIRGYYPSVGFKYWYVSDPNNPFDEYPSTDPSFPAILPTNFYEDIVILDLPQGSGASSDELIPFSTTLQIPVVGDVVYIRDDGSATGVASTAIATATIAARCYAIGIATSSVNYVKTKGQIEINCVGAIGVGEDAFLSTTAGSVTATAPGAIGEAVVYIGEAVEDSSGGKCKISLNIDRPEFIV